MIPLADRLLQDKLAEAMWMEIERGFIHPPLDVLEWLFSTCIGKTDGLPLEAGDKELFNNALDSVRKIADKEGTDLKVRLIELTHVLNSDSDPEERDIFEPIVKLFNAAFEALSTVKLEGLADCTVDPVAINHYKTSLASGTYHEDKPYGPEIALVSRNILGHAGQGDHLAWREVLSTIEVRLRTLSPLEVTDKLDTLKSQYGEVERKVNDLESHSGVSTDENLSTATCEANNLLALKSTSTMSQSQLWEEENAESTSQTGVKRKAEEDDSESSPDAKRIRLDTAEDEVRGDPVREKHCLRVQTAMYAAHLLSSNPDKTHCVGISIRGTVISVGWFDRSGAIESHSWDIIDDLPHFLLLLLIFQRFQEVHWGYYTTGKNSILTVWEDRTEENLMILKLVAEDRRKKGDTSKTSFYIFLNDLIHRSMRLCSRNTNVLGARDREPDVESLESTKENDLVEKLCWPGVDNQNEVTVLKEAEKLAQSISLIDGHIPELVAYVDLPGWNANTGTIRKFLSKSEDATKGSRTMRIMIFKRLVPIDHLDTDSMFQAYCDTMFCHRALWKMGIRHRDISAANLMWDSTKKKGVLNDFDLARFANQIIPGDNGITGTVPFLALDVLESACARNRDAPLYRHELESFTWVFIYLCYSVTKSEEDGTFGLDVPEEIMKWFSKTTSSVSESIRLACICVSKRDLYGFPLRRGPTTTSSHVHRKILPLARYLHSFWTLRYYNRQLTMIRYITAKEERNHDRLRRRLEDLKWPDSDLDSGEVVAPEPYKETDEEVLWKMLVEEHYRGLGEEHYIYIRGLMQTYLDTQWPEVIERLRDT